MINTAVITGVSSRTVNRKKDGKPITIFEVEDSQGTKWTTSRRDIANEANRLIGQAAEIQGREEQNGAFTNYYLEDVREAGFSAAQQAQQAQPRHNEIPEARVHSAPAQQAPIASEGQGTAKDWSIWRQTATKVAAHISENPSSFWGNVDDLIHFYATGVKPQLRNGASQVTAQKFIPDEAVAQVAAEEYSHTDDDIPF